MQVVARLVTFSWIALRVIRFDPKRKLDAYSSLITQPQLTPKS